jgi:hypothetical protein
MPHTHNIAGEVFCRGDPCGRPQVYQSDTGSVTTGISEGDRKGRPYKKNLQEVGVGVKEGVSVTFTIGKIF